MKAFISFLLSNVLLFITLYVLFLSSPFMHEDAEYPALLFTIFMAVPIYLTGRMAWKYYEMIPLVVCMWLFLSTFIWLIASKHETMPECLKMVGYFLGPMAFIASVVKAINGQPKPENWHYDEPHEEDGDALIAS